jgi:hypothetical protein
MAPVSGVVEEAHLVIAEYFRLESAAMPRQSAQPIASAAPFTNRRVESIISMPLLMV